MGRTLKRVPMDFSWPHNKVWGGYVNPYSSQAISCPDCSGTGYSPTAKLYNDQWYGKAPFDPVEYGATPLTVEHPEVQAFAIRNAGERDNAAVQREAQRLFSMWRGQWCHHLIQSDVDALVAEGRLTEFTRLPRTDAQRDALEKQRAEGGGFWMREHNGYVPTADEVNAWSIPGFGHDAINAWVCLKARCAREGVQVECPRCNGEQCLWPTPEIERQCDEWKPTEPPVGPGFQLWETTSEGSPVSPVFDSLESLCEWCEGNASTFGTSRRTSAAEWRRMLDEGFVYHEENGTVFI